MMPTEAIILAGGLGTRLRAAVADRPKVMAPVAGKPFLEHLLEYLQNQGITKAILATGYLHEQIRKYFEDSWGNVELVYSVEDEPLGTGGAIKLALGYAVQQDVFIINGDTFFDVDLKELAQFHEDINADLTLALKEMYDFDRYGTVKVESGRVSGFEEKQYRERGLINGGVYVLRKAMLDTLELPQKFSFEKNVLEKEVAHKRIYGKAFSTYFIDIGIPEDYERAQHELKMNNQQPRTENREPKTENQEPRTENQKPPTSKLDGSWTIFLDRDGVINRKREGGYVKRWDEFEFLDQAVEAIALLSQHFNKLIVVTNQQGIGKKLMTEGDLEAIHEQMLEQVKGAGGRIDKIYFCPNLEAEQHPCRKPNIGMALAAQKDFPDIDFSRSIMLGDSKIDMVFAERAGMMKILIGPADPSEWEVQPDWQFGSLYEAAEYLRRNAT